MRLDVTRAELLILQDAVDDFGPGLTPAAATRLAQLRAKIHALTGEETTRRVGLLKKICGCGKGELCTHPWYLEDGHGNLTRAGEQPGGVR